MRYYEKRTSHYLSGIEYTTTSYDTLNKHVSIKSIYDDALVIISYSA